jgi:nucleotide-binding universal stress UspA family protein
MGYSTLMVHADLGAPSAALLHVAAEMAALFKARVIGIAVCQPLMLAYGDGYMSADVIDQDQRQMELETDQAEAQFRAALGGKDIALEWRSSTGLAVLSDYVAEQGRAADLILVSPEPRGGSIESSRHLSLGELVMRVGRPVLVVPPDIAALDLASVMVAWKDTRETRRAITDALPLLKRAGRVVVAEVADAQELEASRARLADVVAWLALHGVRAERHASASAGDDGARLEAIAREYEAGVMVAGAYGHSRVREWVLGGVTRGLLRGGGRCSLLSH